MASIGMAELFSACLDVLDSEIRLMHYTELTKKALDTLGHGNAEDFQRLKEDVREKLPMRRPFGVVYIAFPFCFCVRRSWFRTNLLFNVDAATPICIPGSAECAEEAAYEAVRRFPHMIQKTHASVERRARACARGLVVEQHVSTWFRKRFPSLWSPPDNLGKWEQPCDHDFKMKRGDAILRIDVTGPRQLDGKYGKPYGGRKPATDIHVIADARGDGVEIYGVTSSLSSDGITEQAAWPITNFLIWLDCGNLLVQGNSVKWQQIKRLVGE